MQLLGRFRLRWIIGLYLYLMQTKQQSLAEECDTCRYMESSDSDGHNHHGLGRHASSRHREMIGNEATLFAEKDIKSNGVVNKALDKAFDWLMGIRDANYGWGQDTPHTIVALLLSKPSWFKDSNLEARLVAKNFDVELILRLWRHKEMPMRKGLLALNIIAMIGLCKDPRSFYSKDLVAMMDHMQGSVEFEEAFGLMTSCMSGKKMKKYQLRKVTHMLRYDNLLHSVDTQSIALLSLRCAEQHARYNLTPYIREGIAFLMREQANDGSFASNLHSTAIALQALIANHHGSSWNATKAQQYIVSHQRDDGSFGNIFDTNAVLPVLAGNSLLSLEQSWCRLNEDSEESQNKDLEDMEYYSELKESEQNIVIEETGKMPNKKISDFKSPSVNHSDESSNINLTFIIWIGNDAQIRYNMSFTVPKNTPFLTVMNMAAKENKNFEFGASEWANGYYVHTLAGKHEKQEGFWFWLLYRLREPPMIGSKPANSLVSSEGITELKPNDGDFILFWYHQI